MARILNFHPRSMEIARYNRKRQENLYLPIHLRFCQHRFSCIHRAENLGSSFRKVARIPFKQWWREHGLDLSSRGIQFRFLEDFLSFFEQFRFAKPNYRCYLIFVASYYLQCQTKQYDWLGYCLHYFIFSHMLTYFDSAMHNWLTLGLFGLHSCTSVASTSIQIFDLNSVCSQLFAFTYCYLITQRFGPFRHLLSSLRESLVLYPIRWDSYRISALVAALPRGLSWRGLLGLHARSHHSIGATVSFPAPSTGSIWGYCFPGIFPWYCFEWTYFSRQWAPFGFSYSQNWTWRGSTLRGLQNS